MLSILFHGEYGWQGFVFAVLLTVAFVLLVNLLATGTLNRLKKVNRTDRKKKERRE
jgi:hypothetical protein